MFYKSPYTLNINIYQYKNCIFFHSVLNTLITFWKKKLRKYKNNKDWNMKFSKNAKICKKNVTEKFCLSISTNLNIM